MLGRQGTLAAILMRNFTRLLIAPALLFALICPAVADRFAVTTYHYNNQRTGWNGRENILSPATLNSNTFGKLWHTTLDGDVAGSPLYVPQVKVDGTKHDVVYAATNANSVYALDSSDGHLLWGPVRVVPPISDVAFLGSGDLHHPNGILSTPAIDLKSQTIYVGALFQPKIQQEFGVWALDLSTGKIKSGWPVILHGSYLGCKFDGGQVLQRGALLLNTDGWLYVPFGARQDRPDWHGWIVGVDTHLPAAKQRLWSPDPHAEGGGIWGVGGPSADLSGNIFVVMGNDFAKHGVDLGQTVTKLLSTPTGLVANIDSKSVFMPRNVVYLNETDEDLGGGGGVILPDLTMTDGTKSIEWDLITTGGKEGVVYLLDRNNLGGIGNSLFSKLYFGDPKIRDLGEIRAVPAFFSAGSAGQFLFYPGEDAGVDGEHALVGLKLGLGADGKPSLTQVWTLPADLQRPASPAVSSDGANNGIVWLVEPDLTTEGGMGPGVLHAYDALTGKELYNSNQNATRDALTHARKFAGPVIVGGKVFVGVDGVMCYGMLPVSEAGAGGN
jgi:hypothetical protein